MRLIDADELIKTLQEERKKGFPANENLTFYVMSSVNHTPTAYDIDKIVEELKNQSFIDNQLNKVVDLDEATEIVKSGGKNEID